jgi:hypothetical protein
VVTSRGRALPPSVEVSIGALVLEGIAVRDEEAFRRAVAISLGRLATEGPAVTSAVADRPAPVVVRHDPASGDEALADSVAGALWSVLSPAQHPLERP